MIDLRCGNGDFETVKLRLRELIGRWEPLLLRLPEVVTVNSRNRQGRNIREITGHMIDSASNNIHRVVHMQYGENPLSFPDYAAFGNNDRWIAIQNYGSGNWRDIVGLWKFIHLHFIHLIGNVDPGKLDNVWTDGSGRQVTLSDMINDFPRHMELHLREIEELISL